MKQTRLLPPGQSAQRHISLLLQSESRWFLDTCPLFADTGLFPLLPLDLHLSVLCGTTTEFPRGIVQSLRFATYYLMR